MHALDLLGGVLKRGGGMKRKELIRANILFVINSNLTYEN